MKTIRRKVFETNSSSTHSVSYCKDSNDYTYYKEDCLNMYVEKGVNPKNNHWEEMVFVKFGEFGWEIEEYNSPMEKLSYIVTMLAELYSNKISCPEDLYALDDFDIIDNAVYEYTGYHIYIDDNTMKMDSFIWDGEKTTYLDFNGYIDHQSSRDRYKTISDFLSDYTLNCHDYIFSEQVVVVTDNDNY